MTTRPPHDVLFGNAERSAPRLSPDGRLVAFLAPVDGVMNLWCGPADDAASARPLTQRRGTGLRPTHEWAHDGEHVLFALDHDGDELFHVHAVSVETGSSRDLTPFDGALTRIVATSPAVPDAVLAVCNRDEPTRPDLVRISISSGTVTPVAQGRGHLVVFADRQLQPRVGVRMDEQGSALLERWDGELWEPLLTLGGEDALGLLLTPQPGLTGDGTALHLIAAAGHDTVGLVRIGMDSGDLVILSADPGVDVEAAFVDAETRTPLAVAVAGPRRRWQSLEPALQPELDRLTASRAGDLDTIMGTADGDRWLATFVDPAGPTWWVLWDREAQRALPLFCDRPALEQFPLGETEPLRWTARDGLPLHGYVTYPPGSERDGLPAVLYVHGGPWQRDRWAWDPLRQLIATRGYACIQVNFRGSTGFGREFLDAGDREWGAKMHDDLLDAVEQVCASGAIDRDRVAIFGGSYGGYAALVGATFTPDAFRAAIAWCPPVNLVTTIESFPAYWAAGLALWKRRVGDPETERDFLLSRSPLTRAHQVRVPLLLVQGENDPRCTRGEADQLVDVLSRNDIPHTYIVVPGEGHGFLRQENNIALLGWIEDFLTEHLPAMPTHAEG